MQWLFHVVTHLFPAAAAASYHGSLHDTLYKSAANAKLNLFHVPHSENL
jgi:hypothetical protein